MAAGMTWAADVGGRPRAVPSLRRYRLVDRATDEEYDADGADLERITGVEVSYIDWAIAEDGAFENGRWWAGEGGGEPAASPGVRHDVTSWYS